MSEDFERLQARFQRGTLVHPSRGAPSLVDLASAFWAAAEVPGLVLTPAAEQLRGRIGEARHLVLVVADGLGLDLLESMPAASFLWQRLASAVTSVFPSTTAVALSSIYTATWPGEHGVTGHWMLGPGATGPMTVLTFSKRGDRADLRASGVDSSEVFGAPGRLGASPRATLFLLPDRVLNGAFSEFGAGGAPRAGFRSLADGVDALLDIVRTAEGPTCTVLYTPRVDDAAHEHGPAHLEVVGAVRALDEELRRLSLGLGEAGRIVLTADHGHLPVVRGGARVLRWDDEVGRHLRTAPTGDARVAYFHFDRDADAEAFAGAFRERYGEQFLLLTPDEVIEAGLLGPDVSAVARARLGDLVGISLGADVLEFRPAGGKADPRLTLRSQHSGLTAAEMRVPVVLI
jgi:hypothetical protein